MPPSTCRQLRPAISAACPANALATSALVMVPVVAAATVGGVGRGDRDKGVGKAMLDCLEPRDGGAELGALPGVGGGRRQ